MTCTSHSQDIALTCPSNDLVVSYQRPTCVCFDLVLTTTEGATCFCPTSSLNGFSLLRHERHLTFICPLLNTAPHSNSSVEKKKEAQRNFALEHRSVQYDGQDTIE